MEDWIIKNEGTWVLAEGFNSFLGRVLHDKTFPSEGRVAMLRLLAYGAGQDDIVLIMHMDRKDHVVMNYAQVIRYIVYQFMAQEHNGSFFFQDFDRLPIQEQEALALLVSTAPEVILYVN